MCLSAAAVVACAVPVAAMCAAIALEGPGAPIYAQERVGRGGRPIRVLKLRTMAADADEHPERYLDERQMGQWLAERKVDDDPRVTRVGRVLRRLSLDELPQFLNVLAGDMSVVGPRPVTRAELAGYGPHADEVLSVRPGITGWWQATERNGATWANGRRLELELWYVRHRSLALDARICAMTLGAMARGRGR